MYESFYLGFTECSEHAAAKAAEKPFSSGKAYAITFVTAAIEHLHAFCDHHLCQFFLPAAFEVMIAEHRHDRHANTQERRQHRFHLLRFTEVCDVAGQDQEIGLVAQPAHRLANAVVALWREMKIS